MKNRIRAQDASYEQALEQIRSGLGQKVSSLSVLDYDMIGLTVPPEALEETAKYLRDTPGLEFQLLTCLSGIDREQHLEVVYHLYSLQGFSLQLKVALPTAKPQVSSVTDIWPAANWYEREAYDMFGIVFKGHPNLTRILTDDDFVGYPLRKSYTNAGGQA